jgi:phytoene synthase
VAGVIGLIMTKIFGQKDPRTDQCAVNLGLALQLTNILRDIHEDSLRGRIYLPQDEIQNYGLNDEDIQKKVVNQQFKDLMSFQIKRTRDFFYKASLGLELITDPQCRFVAFLILELYAKILEQIEENNFDVYTKRAIVPAFKKMKTIASLAFRSLQKSYIFKQ